MFHFLVGLWFYLLFCGGMECNVLGYMECNVTRWMSLEQKVSFVFCGFGGFVCVWWRVYTVCVGCLVVGVVASAVSVSRLSSSLCVASSASMSHLMQFHVSCSAGADGRIVHRRWAHLLHVLHSIHVSSVSVCSRNSVSQYTHVSSNSTGPGMSCWICVGVPRYGSGRILASFMCMVLCLVLVPRVYCTSRLGVSTRVIV